MFGKLFGKLTGKKETLSKAVEAHVIPEEDDLDWEDDEELDAQESETEELDTAVFTAFCETFGDVTIQKVNAKKKGICLEASNAQGAKILMDYYENNLVDLPDGSNAYFFGNKLIIVTRWADMSDAEKQKVETAELAIALHPYPCVQVSLKVDHNWGDAIVNLYHCYSALNDESAPVDEAILIFTDTADANYVSCRRVALPGFIQKFLQRCNVNSHKTLPFDTFISPMRLEAKHDPKQTFSDKLYDMCWEMTNDYYHAARRADLDNIADGVYMEIDETNRVTKAYQNN